MEGEVEVLFLILLLGLFTVVEEEGKEAGRL